LGERGRKGNAVFAKRRFLSSQPSVQSVSCQSFCFLTALFGPQPLSHTHPSLSKSRHTVTFVDSQALNPSHLPSQTLLQSRHKEPIFGR